MIVCVSFLVRSLSECNVLLNSAYRSFRLDLRFTSFFVFFNYCYYNSTLEARKKTPPLPYSLLEAHLGHLLERRSTQQHRCLGGQALPPCTPYTSGSAGTGWAMPPPPSPYGGQPYPKGPSLGRIVNWKEAGCGRPQLRFKDIRKRDLKAVAINTDTWEARACDRCAWRQRLQRGLSSNEDTRTQEAEENSPQKVSPPDRQPASTFCCAQCDRD